MRAHHFHPRHCALCRPQSAKPYGRRISLMISTDLKVAALMFLQNF